MYEERIKNLRKLSAMIAICDNQISCFECPQYEDCSGYKNTMLSSEFEQTADALEALLKAARAMHLWIFNHSVDEQEAYDECGLSDEMNAELGYGGKLIIEMPKEETK